MTINADDVWAAALDIMAQPTPRTEPIKLTRAQFDAATAAFGTNVLPPDGLVGVSFAGVPIELVDGEEQSTPFVEGWSR